MGYAILFGVLFPDTPMKARFLNERQRIIAVQRLKKNNTGIQTRKFKFSHFWDALRDPQLYLLGIIIFGYAFALSAIGRYEKPLQH